MNACCATFALTLVAAYGAATKADAQTTYTLDTSFQTPFASENVNGIALLPSGKLFASGMMKYPTDPVGAGGFRGCARLNPDGSRDMTFPGFPQSTGAGKIVPWSNKFYVHAGSVRRLNNDGILDPFFVVQNLGLDPYMQSSSGEDFHVYPDGSLLVVGGFQINDTVRGHVGSYDLAWLSNAGYYDTTRTPRRCQPGRTILHLEELPNGQFICSGNANQFEGKSVDWVFRFNADGTPDTTFRTGVYVGGAWTFLPLADGRVYAGGDFRRSVTPQDTLRLVRFMPDGSLDSTFTMPVFNDDGLNGPYIGPGVMVIEPWFNHTLLIAGQFALVNGEPRKGICVIDSTGQLMPDFDACGVGPVPSSFANYTYQGVADVLLDTANNYLYIAGAYRGYNDGTVNDTAQGFVSRLIINQLSTNVGEHWPTALTTYPNPSTGAFTLELDLPANAPITGDLLLQVFDMQGRQVVARGLGRDRYQRIALDLANEPAGLYSAHLSDGRRILTGVRLVVE